MSESLMVRGYRNATERYRERIGVQPNELVVRITVTQSPEQEEKIAVKLRDRFEVDRLMAQHYEEGRIAFKPYPTFSTPEMDQQLPLTELFSLDVMGEIGRSEPEILRHLLPERSSVRTINITDFVRDLKSLPKPQSAYATIVKLDTDPRLITISSPK